MPVIEKAKMARIRHELSARYSALIRMLETRSLNSNSEGAGKGRWAYPEKMCATEGAALDISMAVADFKTILAEITRLK